MSSDRRPDPDALLSLLDEEQKLDGQGKLRIFLGMSAGVGKTYTMLRASHQKIKEGVRVLIGAVETHGRSETMLLTEGLNLVPLKKITYRGTILEEMDLDEILRLNPDLVIVDELAHTNAPGSRHEKRYQDVNELLDAGIDVYTAFNVQHLESRKDSVEAITGIQIRETIPDSILERASQVELVDIAPSELLKRLREGKIYLGDKALRAEQNFFKEDKLTALREIALRMTAERVDQDLQKLVRVHSNGSPWQTNERLLVAISHSPYSEKLIRATRRIAYNLEAPWIALHVNTGVVLSDQDLAQLAKNLNLARELKAEVIATTAVDVPSAVRRISRLKNVTQVVVGRPTRRWFRQLIEGGGLLDRLVNESQEVDIHIIRQEGVSPHRPSLFEELSHYPSKTGMIKYYYASWWLIGVSILGAVIEPYTGYRAVGFLFLLAVVIVSMFGSVGAVIYTAAISALVWDYFFIPPRMTFFISASEDFLMCAAFFVVATITGFLTNRVRFHERLTSEREERTNVLYEVLQDIANATEKSDFLNKVTFRVGQLLNAKCGVILKSVTKIAEEGERLDFSESKQYSIKLDKKEQAIAEWCFDNGKSAGWSTDTLSQSKNLFIPLRGVNESIGVFIFHPKKSARRLDLETENLLLSIVRQLGGSIERHFLTKRLTESQRIQDSEKLHQTLLNSISHEMRTPLTAILGVASAVKDPQLSASLHEAGNRLNRVIENLLDMSRLNSGVLSLKLEWHDLNDLLSVATQKLGKILDGHKIKTDFPEPAGLLQIDYRLMEHALSNVILNAATYSPVGSEIRIRARYFPDRFHLQIENDGPCIPEDSLTKVFDKFYRVPGSPTGGIGLGLSIVKSIVELHRGEISVTNLQPQGVCFHMELPLDKQPQIPLEQEP